MSVSISATSPEKTGVTPEAKYAVLATAAYLFRPEQGSHLLRRALLASILADRLGLDPQEAIEQAMYGCDFRVVAAGDECERLIKQAERAVLAAEQDGQVAR
ncbi:hypothetical protein [Nonomuraea basaltis]|uniref:hypothetical protein n=1 Tax=Nonomuraea basaltis TaxID=2495887 RepID=UPI00110C6856|nr:hypothetical protein [Nonomuraea basaltis]TMS00114.1 hypothetical protein EJK15_03320 [Nonomuraea basaltis]